MSQLLSCKVNIPTYNAALILEEAQRINIS